MEVSAQAELLNMRIDSMRQGRCPHMGALPRATTATADGNPLPSACTPAPPGLMEMAALLFAASPGADDPDPAFVARLRHVVLSPNWDTGA